MKRTSACLLVTKRKLFVRLGDRCFSWKIVQSDHKETENSKKWVKSVVKGPEAPFWDQNIFKNCPRTEKQARTLIGWLLSLFQTKLACCNKNTENLISAKQPTLLNCQFSPAVKTSRDPKNIFAGREIGLARSAGPICQENFRQEIYSTEVSIALENRDKLCTLKKNFFQVN